MEKNFKKFWAFAKKPINPQKVWAFVKKHFKGFCFGFAGFVIIGALLVWESISCNGDMPTFIITLVAFLAAAYAICQQHKAGIKQEIIGAWQILANKAAGNSGKIEAIQFLAKQKIPLIGINMSADHNGGEVWLHDLDVSTKTLGHSVYLYLANFKGANLNKADFENGCLQQAHFEEAGLWFANFKGANLSMAHFEVAQNLDPKSFQDNFIVADDKINKENYLPKTLASDPFKFVFDDTKPSKTIFDKDGKSLGDTIHFIKLVKNNPTSTQ